ncbi:MAG: RNA polymerase sigma factor [Patescibacteria group bacterium]|jgi:RNA polymerase sigma-70 factor (ECF subfamily)|nr:RNA polymerase sigma factor [Patescibacteria group bacterium]
MFHLREKILFHQIKNGDEQAFTVFYNTYKDRIYRFIYFKVSDREKVYDLVSEVFIKIYDYIKEGNDIDNFQAFLYKIARNLVIDFYRTKKEEISLTDAPETVSPINLEKEVGDKVAVENVKRYLNKIKPEYREAVHLHFFENFSFSEIADIINQSEGNVRIRVYRGIKQLKEVLRG